MPIHLLQGWRSQHAHRSLPASLIGLPADLQRGEGASSGLAAHGEVGE